MKPSCYASVKKADKLVLTVVKYLFRNHGATPTRLTNTGTSTRGPMTAAVYEVERVSGAGRDFAC